MRRLLPVMMLLFLVINVQAQTARPDLPIGAVEIVRIFPYAENDTVRIYYQDDLMLMESSYQFDSSSVHLKLDSSGQVIGEEQRHHLTERRKLYFVYQKGGRYGYEFRPQGPVAFPVMLRVDPTVKMRSGFIGSADFLKNEHSDSSSRSADGRERRDVFLTRATDSTAPCRIVLCYNSSRNDIPFSFSEELDGRAGMKLVRAEFHLDGFFHKPSNSRVPPMLVQNEMYPIAVADPDAIRRMLQLYVVLSGVH